MPDITPHEPEQAETVIARLIADGALQPFDDADNPHWKYRVTQLYANTAPPPAHAGGVATQTLHTTRTGADRHAAKARELDNIGRVMIEERLDDTLIRGVRDRHTSQWRTVGNWTRETTTTTVTSEEGWHAS